jgi:putative hemolysin
MMTMSLATGPDFPKASRPAPVRFTYSTRDQPWLQRAVIQAIEIAGGQLRLKRLYRKYEQAVDTEGGFFDTALRLLDIDIDFDAAMLDLVPRTGPVLFVANHPYGVLDGLILAALAAKVRPDVKVLANSVLCQVRGASRHLLPIDFGPTEEAQRTTLNSRIEAQGWLRQGNAIGIFPGGAISTTPHPFARPAADLPWAPFTAKLIRQSKATVVPIFFAGQNSRMFQLASHFSVTLRLSLVFRETARRIGTPVKVRIGTPIAFDELDTMADRSVMVQELRRRTFALARNGDVPGSSNDLHLRIGRIKQ